MGKGNKEVGRRIDPNITEVFSCQLPKCPIIKVLTLFYYAEKESPNGKAFPVNGKIHSPIAFRVVGIRKMVVKPIVFSILLGYRYV